MTAAGHKVAAQTVANYRRRYQADGVVGLADHRPVRKKREFGSVDDTVVAAMRQAIADAVAALLTRAHAGPDRPQRGKATKNPPATPAPAEPAAEPAESEELAEVIPLGLFDPLENPCLPRKLDQRLLFKARSPMPAPSRFLIANTSLACSALRNNRPTAQLRLS